MTDETIANDNTAKTANTQTSSQSDDNVAANDQAGFAGSKTEAEVNNEEARLRDDLNQMTEAAKRAMADLQNFKKRVEEEKKSWQQFANMALILELLPLTGNLKRAVQQIPQEISQNAWVTGVVNIEKQFTELLGKQGLTEIRTAGEVFDSFKHEAVMQGPGAKDQIIEVFETGYMLGDKVLKPAKVKVGDGS